MLTVQSWLHDSLIARVWHHFEGGYARLFSVAEIAREPILKWSFGASLLFFFSTFETWIRSSGMTVETAQSGKAVCWPFFQQCYNFYFLHALPYGYSQTELYMLFYGVMMLIVYLMWREQWAKAHMLLLVLLLWKVFVIMLSYDVAGPYDYYHVILTAILLFVPYKEYFLKVGFVFLYFMSVTMKFDPTWVLGTYFTSLKTGLPIFPTTWTPVFTNLVIFMQVVGCWFLLSRNMILQRLSLIYFTIFHLYSGIFVYYHYPTTALPPLLILFGPMYRHTPTPFSRKALAGWIIIILVALSQIVGFLISPDRRMTLEGNRYGMFMFDANHQCVATVTMYTKGAQLDTDTKLPSGTGCSGFYCLVETSVQSQNDETASIDRYESVSAWNRCDPYEWYTRLNQRCASNPDIQRIAFQFDHSVDGGPFYRIVDVANICALSYLPFSHNDWIQLPGTAPIVGYPVQNVYSY